LHLDKVRAKGRYSSSNLPGAVKGIYSTNESQCLQPETGTRRHPFLQPTIDFMAVIPQKRRDTIDHALFAAESRIFIVDHQDSHVRDLEIFKTNVFRPGPRRFQR
jgi:hypothetical protein